MIRALKRLWYLYQYDRAMCRLFRVLVYVLRANEAQAASIVADKLTDMLSERSKLFLEGIR
jgi:hypothetical protein